MKRQRILLGIAMVLVVGAVAAGEPSVQLDEGWGGGRSVGAPVPLPLRTLSEAPAPAAPVVVCPDGTGAIDGVRARRFAAAGAAVVSADGDWLFTDSGVPDTGATWNGDGRARSVSIWLSGDDCARADGVTDALDRVDVLVLFDPPEIIVPNLERFKQVVVITSDVALADGYLAVWELYRAAGFGENSFVVLNGCAGREPDVERTVLALMTGAAR